MTSEDNPPSNPPPPSQHEPWPSWTQASAWQKPEAEPLLPLRDLRPPPAHPEAAATPPAPDETQTPETMPPELLAAPEPPELSAAPEPAEEPEPVEEVRPSRSRRERPVPPEREPFAAFKPGTALGTMYGGAAFVLCALLGGGLLYKGLTMAAGPKEIGPLIAGGAFVMLGALYLYWTWGCSSLRYTIDRNALTINWGGVRQVVPLGSIERILPAGEGESPSIEGVNWVGHHVGKATVEGVGEVLFYSAHRALSEVLYVQTERQTYGLSLPDHVAFAEQLQAHHDRGPLFEARQGVQRFGVSAQTFWLDGVARLLALVLLGVFVAVLAYVLRMYPDTAQQVSLRFPSIEGVVRVADKSALLDIPRSAAGFLLLDLVLAILVHGWERMVSYVLLVAGIGVQVMLLVAAIVAVAS